MNVYIGSKSVGRKSISSSFFHFCIKKHPSLLLVYFINKFYYLLSFLPFLNKISYHKKYWRFLGKIRDLDIIIGEYCIFYNRQKYEWFLNSDHTKDHFYDDAPQFLLEYVFKKEGFDKLYGLAIDERGYPLDIKNTNSLKIPNVADLDTTYYVSEDKKWLRDHEQTVYVLTDECVHGLQKYKCKKRKKALVDYMILIIVAFVLFYITLQFGTIDANPYIISSILSDFTLIILNVLPIIFLLFLFYGIFNSLSLSILIGGMLIFVLNMINYFKLLYRDEPFYIRDILLVQEAGDMAGKYDISFNLNQWGVVFLLIGLAFIAHKFFSRIKLSCKTRIVFIFLDCLVFLSLFINVYQNDTIYECHGDISIINRWSQTQVYQVKGFLYPFLYSYTDAFEKEPDNYNPAIAEKTLESYTYDDIPDNKKSNFIGIMLESYNDFSKFDTIDFLNDPYMNFHLLQDEAISGDFISNIFAGGTVASERSFLNGFQNHPDYLMNTNSFVRYFGEQGYYTEAMHPSFGWFYNRRNINNYLGFDNFYYIENHFNEIINDDLLFDEIIQGYEKNKERDQPYLNFTVTYQNHGPYETVPTTDQVYLQRNDEIADDEYNVVNNYLSGIYKTDQALKTLFDYFRNDEEPMIIILFGDHNPLLGDGNSGYLQNGINLDLGSMEGFKNYYGIPYLIWGNDAAKEMYDVTFTETGESFSPVYFIPYLFSYLDLEGNEYIKYLQDIYQIMPVMNNAYYKIHDEWKQVLSDEEQTFYNDFVNTEYYYSHNLWQSK